MRIRVMGSLRTPAPEQVESAANVLLSVSLGGVSEVALSSIGGQTRLLLSEIADLLQLRAVIDMPQHRAGAEAVVWLKAVAIAETDEGHKYAALGRFISARHGNVPVIMVEPDGSIECVVAGGGDE